MAMFCRWIAVLCILVMKSSYSQVYCQIQSDAETVTPTGLATEAQPEESEPQNSGLVRSWTGQDAIVETTPAVCSHGVRCGFQIYDQFTKKPIQPFITYCSCPEGTECLRAGENMLQKFTFYKCRGVAEPAEMEIITGPSEDGTVVSPVTEETLKNPSNEDVNPQNSESDSTSDAN